MLTSYFGVFAYLITQGRGMAEPNAQQAQHARDELRRVVGFSVADEIAELDQLKKSGSITNDESGVFVPNCYNRGGFGRSALPRRGSCADNVIE
jgi:hypothetical protein